MVKADSKRYITDSTLILIGSILFSLAHPGLLNNRGFSVCGMVSLVPVILLIYKSDIKFLWLKGFIYGVISYLAFGFWMLRFQWLVLIIIALIYGIYLAIVFVLSKLIFNLFSPEKMQGSKRKLPVLAEIISFCCLWGFYEYLKTVGFIGLSYGTIGYTQWQNTLLLQTASFGGVYFPSLYCSLTSCVIAFCIISAVRIKNEQVELLKEKPGAKQLCFTALKAVKENILNLILFICLTAFCVIYGSVKISQNNEQEFKTVKMAAMQTNTDPWKGSVDRYAKDVRTLEKLSDTALSEHPDLDIIVWPETAVVPPIVHHYKERRNYSRYQLIYGLLEYINSKDCTFIIGNQHTEDNGGTYKDDYNAVLVFDSSENNVIPPQPEIYKKMHLVPFTEYFPYGKIFPHIYKMLLNGDTHLWTKGEVPVVFNKAGIRFSAPICFEDTFGYTCREFVNQENGAQLFVNVSNDSWSKTDACQYQHLAMAVYRCAENRIPEIRSTASGVTSFVDSTGKVISYTKSFERNYLYAEVKVPQNTQKSVYTKYGDFFPFIELIILIILIAAGLIGIAKNGSRKE